MKLINDTLSSAGLYIPPLLKLINEYAWQSYLEHPPNLQMINKTLSGSMGLYLPPLLQLIHEYARGEHDLKQQCLKPLVDYSAMMPMTPRSTIDRVFCSMVSIMMEILFFCKISSQRNGI